MPPPVVLQVRARKSFAVKAPPLKKYTVGGMLVPTVRSALVGKVNTRRVCIDILSTERGPGRFPNSASDLREQDVLVLRLLKPKPPSAAWAGGITAVFTDDEDDETSSLGTVDVEDDDAWQENRCFPLSSICEAKVDGCVWEATMGEHHLTEVREFRFASLEECQEFVALLQTLQAFQKQLAEQETILEEHLSSRNMGIEVVAASSTDTTKSSTMDDIVGAYTDATAETDAKKEKKPRTFMRRSPPKEKTPRKTTSPGNTTSTTPPAPAPVQTPPTVKTKTTANKVDDDSTNNAAAAAATTTKSKENPDKLLVEIVSGSDLPAADRNTSDPYVLIWSGKNNKMLLHKTKPVMQTCDPIWSVKTNSLSVIDVNEIDDDDGLTFQVKDHDTVGKNLILGTVTVSKEELLKQTGDRMEHLLKVTLKKHDASKFLHAPKLNLRIRPAVPGDEVFLKTLREITPKSKGVYANSTFVAPKAHTINRFNRETKASDRGLLHRVKPGPDPARAEEVTKWMTKQQIAAEHLKPSTSWIESGSGHLGRIYFEVLSCSKLPNKDTGIMGDKTDAFCSIIYEDAIVNTDVINDELDPRWMPWSQRAFCFHVGHPTKQILLGVFDYDVTDAHDPIGRVTIDMSNFRNQTEYILTFTLFESVMDEIREPQGTITVRLRLDMNIRQRVLAAATLPPTNFVNVTTMNDFQSAFFVTSGEENLAQLDMAALKSYGNELEGYLDLLYYIKHALMTILLWRGHYPVNLCGCKFKLAIHSVVAFIMGIFVAEDLDLVPGFMLFSVAWFLLATNEQRQRHPSPWHQSFTFGQLWFALIFGYMKDEPTIADGEMEPLIKNYEAELEERRKKKTEKAQKLKEVDEQFAKEESETQKQDEDVEELETKTGGGISLSTLNPLKPILLPLQKILGQVCVSLRVVRSIVTWDENGVAFLLTNLCLAGSLVLIWVPWSFLVHWSLRIIVWVFLGPWMKLLDWFVVQKLQSDGDNFVKRMESNMEERSRLLLLKKRIILTRKEEAVKLKAMKRYMFGKYAVRVPQFKEYRYPDIPLPQSTAAPHDGDSYSSVKIVERKHGQRLVGHMIPVWGNAEDTALVTEVAKEKEGMMSRNSPLKLFRRNK